jgi:hypothetical protein
MAEFERRPLNVALIVMSALGIAALVLGAGFVLR